MDDTRSSSLPPEEVLQNPIITPNDTRRWPLLGMPSQMCDMPLSPEDNEQCLYMAALLDGLGDKAIGLAAVQIGWPKQLFILREPGTGRLSTYINPVVLEVSPETTRKHEACLSLPDFSVRVNRPKWVKLRYINVDGDVEEKTFHGIMSRAVMHEMDHLAGRLIHSYVDDDITHVINKKKNQAAAKANRVTKRRTTNKMRKNSRKRNR